MDNSSNIPSSLAGIPGLGRLGNIASTSVQGSRIPEQHSSSGLVEQQNAAPILEKAHEEADSEMQETQETQYEVKPENTQEKTIPAEADVRMTEPIAQDPAPAANTIDESIEAAQPSMIEEPKIEAPKPSEIESNVETSDSPSITHALEALLGGLETGTAKEVSSDPLGDAMTGVAEQEEHPEWEVDSSPYESSSEDSSSDSSSESEDGDNAYKLLSPEEQARILMEGDGLSDDEGGGAAKGAGSHLRTKNEISEEIIPKPDVTVTPEMPIQELGDVEAIVEGIVLVKANTSGEFRVLESGSVLCLADRSVIGVVSETLGRVQQPLYSVRFTNMAEITEAGISKGTTIFYSETHSTYVFTQAIRAIKGSDASNLHDEEVNDDEVEFSDDEAEMEHKRRIKAKKLERRGGKAPSSGRGPHPLQEQYTASSLSYDDAEDDGPYKTLTRPASLAEPGFHTQGTEEISYRNAGDHSGVFRGRGRGGDRGRGGRGDRSRGQGRGREGQRQRGGFSRAPQGGPAGNGAFQSGSSGSGGSGFPSNQYQAPNQQWPANSSPAPNPNPYFNAPPPQQQPQDQYSPHQPQIWPTQGSPFQQQHQQQQQQQHPSSAPQQPPMRFPGGGAFINPAFFAAAAQQQTPHPAGSPAPNPPQRWDTLYQPGPPGSQGHGPGSG